MKSNQELYAFLDELITKLHHAGHPDLAENLKGAMYISSSATEVFMEVRYELTKLSHSAIELDSDTRDKITEAIGDIGRALR